jgi:hypothetical protein
MYKQLIRPMMDYPCPIWRSAVRSHVRKLQVLQSKCLRIATNAPWYVGNRQIHEDLDIPFFADHIRALTDSFDSKLADAWNPLVRQIGRHLCRPRANLNRLGNRCDLMSSRPAVAVSQKTAKSAQRAVPGLLGCSDCGFPCFFSVVRRMPGHNEKKGTIRIPITEAFSQNDPKTSEFHSQENHPTKILGRRISCQMGQSPTTSNVPCLNVKAFCRDSSPLAQAQFPVLV